MRNVELEVHLKDEILVADGVSGAGQWLNQWNMQVEMLPLWGSCDKYRIGVHIPSSFPPLLHSSHRKPEVEGCRASGDAPQL